VSPANPLLNEILRVRKPSVAEVHVALRRRSVRVPQERAGLLDPVFPADFRAKFVAGEIQHQISGQTSHVTRPGQIGW